MRTQILLLLLVLSAQSAWSQPRSKRLLILVVPGLTADDLTRPELPSLRAVVPKSAVGWMNMRTARIPGDRSNSDSEEAEYVTLGAGSRAVAGPWACELNAASVERLKRENKGLDHPIQIGALGELIHRNGLTTSVYGNSDDLKPRRAANFIAADSEGVIDQDSSFELKSSPGQSLAPDCPFGKSSDYYYSLLFGPDHSPPQLRLWVAGDLARAKRYSKLCLPSKATEHLQNALQALDFVIGAFDSNLLSAGTNMFIVGTGTDTPGGGDRLSPVLLCGPDISAGLLTSGSTQTRGLVANTDFLPTAAKILGLNTPPGLVGRPMTVTGYAISVDEWADMYKHWKIRSEQQSVLGGFPTGQMLVVMCTIGIGFGLRKRVFSATFHNGFERLARALPIAVLALPILGILLPAVNPGSVWVSCLCLAAVTSGLVVLGMWKPASVGEIATGLLAALVLVLACDLPTGQHLLKQAWMSYSVMEGARYYGIGNEYSGAVITGSLLIALRLLRGRRERFWSAALALLGVIAALIGLPAAGANAGCFVGAAFGFGIAGIVWWKGRLRARDALTIALVTAALLAGTLVLDLARSGDTQSHIARAINYGGSITNIAWRKLMLNAYLLLHSPWSLALIAAASGLWELCRSPDSWLRARVANDRIARGSALGILAAAIAIFLVNDSGVVAAAESLLIAWAGAMDFTDRAHLSGSSAASQA